MKLTPKQREVLRLADERKETVWLAPGERDPAVFDIRTDKPHRLAMSEVEQMVEGGILYEGRHPVLLGRHWALTELGRTALEEKEPPCQKS